MKPHRGNSLTGRCQASTKIADRGWATRSMHPIGNSRISNINSMISSIKMKFFHCFWLQVSAQCSNLRVAENPLFCWLVRGGQSRGFVLSGERAVALSVCEGESLAAIKLFIACAKAQRSSQKEDTRTYGNSRKENVEDAACNRVGGSDWH